MKERKSEGKCSWTVSSELAALGCVEDVFKLVVQGWVKYFLVRRKVGMLHWACGPNACREGSGAGRQFERRMHIVGEVEE